MTETSMVLPSLGWLEWGLLWFVLGSAFFALGYGCYLVRKVMARDPGTPRMQEVAKAVEEGAMAYLRRQFKTMIWFVVLITTGLYFVYRPIYAGDPDLTVRTVPVGAFLVVEEVRRQFKETPGIMVWKEKPDYGRCVSIVTAAAQKELIGPGVLAIFTPIAVAFGLGAGALGGYLAGAIISAQIAAVYMANTGAAWDNAKKKIEDGLFGGKATEFHKAAVIGDTVGDPYKDTAGPALNPLIKVMNLVGILIAPLLIENLSPWIRIVVVSLCLILLGAAVAFSKRGTIVKTEQRLEGRRLWKAATE